MSQTRVHSFPFYQGLDGVTIWAWSGLCNVRRIQGWWRAASGKYFLFVINVRVFCIFLPAFGHGCVRAYCLMLLQPSSHERQTKCIAERLTQGPYATELLNLQALLYFLLCEKNKLLLFGWVFYLQLKTI